MKITTTKNHSNDKLKLLVYGEPGSGKTSLAKTLNEETLIISAEAGLLCLNGADIDVIDITQDDNEKMLAKEKRIERLGEVYKFLLTDEARAKYKWIFIDSLTEINQNMLEQLQTEFTDPAQTLKMYGELSKRMKSLIKSFRDLPYYNVVMTALSEVDKDENNQRFIGVSLIGSMSKQIPAFFDEVLYLHTSIDQESGDTKRVLVTGKSDKLMAKDRSGKLDKLEQPSLATIAKKIRGE